MARLSARHCKRPYRSPAHILSTTCCQIYPTTKELLFGIIPISKETKLIYNFNYTTLAMRHYIYSNKINSKGIYMHEFINKLSLMYNLENIKNFKKKKKAQCSHFRSRAEVSFLPSANIRKRASANREVIFLCWVGHTLCNVL